MLLSLILIAIFILSVRNIIKNYLLLRKLKQEKDFLPHTSSLFGILSEFNRLHYENLHGLAVVKQLAIRGRTVPFCETGAVIMWGGNLLLSVPILVPTRIETWRAILANKKFLDKGITYIGMKDIFGQGLITSDKQTWTKHRKLLNPTFSLGMIHNFVPGISFQTERLMKNLEKEVLLAPLVSNFTELISRAVMATLLETIMGASENDIDTRFREIAENFDNNQMKRIQWFPKMWSWAYSWTAEGKKYLEDAKFLRDQATKLINQRMKQLSESQSADDKITLIDPLIYEHIKDSKNMTLKMITDQVVTFLGGGWDTTTWTATFALQLIGENPKIQEKIIQEIDSELYSISDDHVWTKNDISKLKYLECVILESLRLYPVVNAHLRYLYEELEVEIDGKIRKFPAGSEVIFDPYLIHRNPKYWKDPDRFSPERFLPENSAGRDPLSFVAFSFGPRNCIGKTFAMFELKVMLGHIFRKFKVRSAVPSDKMELVETGIGKRTKEPLHFYFEVRQ